MCITHVCDARAHVQHMRHVRAHNTCMCAIDMCDARTCHNMYVRCAHTHVHALCNNNACEFIVNITYVCVRHTLCTVKYSTLPSCNRWALPPTISACNFSNRLSQFLLSYILHASVNVPPACLQCPNRIPSLSPYWTFADGAQQPTSKQVSVCTSYVIHCQVFYFSFL